MPTPVKPPLAPDGDERPVLKSAQELTQEAPVYPKLLSTKELLANAGRMAPEEILAHINARKALKAILDEEQAAEDEAKAAEARLRVVEQIIIEKENDQKVCPHRKQNGEPRIGAQRMHSGSVIWVCQWCGKIWKNNELPDHLQIDGSRVGGP